MRAVIYLRQSKDREGNELAIERQRAECRRLCERRGWTIAEEVIENNQSASKPAVPGSSESSACLSSRPRTASSCSASTGCSA